ncbi:hypothetical protein BJX63DRAFT_415470 [Aspergillus granulosus]|uniref:Secreted protein n=1 Tax=Aspergillus granulosus TaxID=176169 RepID=A0ABR4GT65_9EURO
MSLSSRSRPALLVLLMRIDLVKPRSRLRAPRRISKTASDLISSRRLSWRYKQQSKSRGRTFLGSPVATQDIESKMKCS